MHIREAKLGLLARARADLPNLVSLLVFFSATALFFRSIEFALVVTASLGFHELGHAAALAWMHLDFRISFGLVGAWTSSSSQERERLSQLSNTLIHLAGPLFSLVLAQVALGLHEIWDPPSHHLLILANFSAQVGFFNLLPLGSLTDGGKAVRRMSDALRGTRRMPAVILPFFLTVLMLVLYALVAMPRMGAENARPFLLSLLLVGTWLASSLFIETRHARPGASEIPQPMKTRQAYLLILLIWDILLFCVVIMSATPFWLSPDYVYGYLENLTGLVNLLAQLVSAIY
jgi:hypothetical protein